MQAQKKDFLFFFLSTRVVIKWVKAEFNFHELLELEAGVLGRQATAIKKCYQMLTVNMRWFGFCKCNYEQKIAFSHSMKSHVFVNGIADKSVKTKLNVNRASHLATVTPSNSSQTTCLWGSLSWNALDWWHFKGVFHGLGDSFRTFEEKKNFGQDKRKI